MSILDGPMGDLAATLLDSVQLGTRPATIRRPGSGSSYDTSTSTYTGGNPDTDYPCRVAFEEFRDDQIDGTLIKVGDRIAIVARKTIGIEPDADSDQLIVGADPNAESAVKWGIERVIGVSSGEEEAIYQLHVRR